MLRKCYYYWELNTLPGWRMGNVGDPAMPKAAPSLPVGGIQSKGKTDFPRQWQPRMGKAGMGEPRRGVSVLGQ